MLMSKPFVKWVGGKRQILPVLLKNLPVSVKELNEKEGVYIEPFLGGGAVFFALQKQGLKKAFLNDTNAELMNVYRVVQQVADTLSATLERDNFKNEKEAYLSVRDWDRDENWPYNKSDIERAARFILILLTFLSPQPLLLLDTRQMASIKRCRKIWLKSVVILQREMSLGYCLIPALNCRISFLVLFRELRPLRFQHHDISIVTLINAKK